MRWLEKYNKPAPIEFNKLLHLISEHEGLLKAIDNLLIQKRSSLELGVLPQIPEIHNFIESELERIESILPQHFEKKILSLIYLKHLEWFLERLGRNHFS